MSIYPDFNAKSTFVALKGMTDALRVKIITLTPDPCNLEKHWNVRKACECLYRVPKCVAKVRGSIEHMTLRHDTT
jgi:hypothetical protein